MADETTENAQKTLELVSQDAPVEDADVGSDSDATGLSDAPIKGEPLPEGPTETSNAAPVDPAPSEEATPATETVQAPGEAQSLPAGDVDAPATDALPENPIDNASGAAPVSEEAEAAAAQDPAALPSDEASKPSDSEAAPLEEAPTEAPPAEEAEEAKDANPSETAPAVLPNTGDVVEDGYPLPAPAAPAIHPTTLEPMVGDGLGEDLGKKSDAELPKADELNIPPSAPPADQAGAPNSGKPMNIPDTSIDLSGGYPVAVDAPAVHPTTFQPLVNDGVGEDVGKVADLPTTDDGKGVVDFPQQAAVDAPSKEEDAPKDDAAPKQELGSAPHHDGGTKKLEHKIAQALEKLAHLEHMVKRLLGELL